MRTSLKHTTSMLAAMLLALTYSSGTITVLYPGNVPGESATIPAVFASRTGQ